MSRYRGEKGNVAPLAVALCLVLVMTLGFLADCAVLYGAKARQEQALDAARSACMDAGQAASAKYGDDAGAVLADSIVDQIRGQGVEGAVSVWFYEAPARAVAESERVWVVGGHAGGGGESPSVCRKLRPRCEGGFEPGVQRPSVCGAESLAA